jgi:hypothetical protein
MALEVKYAKLFVGIFEKIDRIGYLRFMEPSMPLVPNVKLRRKNLDLL